MSTAANPYTLLDKQKLLIGSCTDSRSLMSNLSSGAACKLDFQCYSRLCEDNMCKGGYAGDPCTNDEECSGNYYCGIYQSDGLTWPMCTPAKKVGVNCT